MLRDLVDRLTDRAKARIRTLWPYAVGAVAAYLLSKTGTRPLGIPVDSATAIAIVGWVFGTVVYEAGKWLSGRTGTGRLAQAARWAGRFLLSLGLPIGAPEYPTPAPQGRFGTLRGDRR